MNAASLLAELAEAGIAVVRDGDRLRVRGESSASIAYFTDRIRESKSALLRELLQREIVTTATVDRSQFDREHYDDVWQQWRALPDPQAKAAAMVLQLEDGWHWLDAHPNHPGHVPFVDRSVIRLRDYERAFTLHQAGEPRP